MTSDLLGRLTEALAERYAIARELGRGGMATVYLAEDLKHHRKVAIKVLKPELAAMLGPERFLREIEIAAQLNHPHIVPLYDSGEAGGFLFYVMPYVEGDSLRERLKRQGQLPIEEAVRIACEIAAALSYAHSIGLVHRDIKPENVLLQYDEARVTDFGIARAVEAAGGERLTQTGLALGTPAYMSPEQATGEPQVDSRSDIYSLACVLYELLVGEPPFTGPSAQTVIARHASSGVPSIRAVRGRVPAYVEDAVNTALAKTPADRFSTASQFVEALTGRSQPRPAESARGHARVNRLRAIPRAVFLGATALLLLTIAVVDRIAPGKMADVNRDVVLVAPIEDSVFGQSPDVPSHLARMLYSIMADGLGPLRALDPARYGSDLNGADDYAVRAVSQRLGAGLSVRTTIRLAGEREGITNRVIAEARLSDVRDSKVVRVHGMPIVRWDRDLERLVVALFMNEIEQRADRREILARVKTPAILSYWRGKAALGRGEYGRAIELFDRAIQDDSGFALVGLELTIAGCAAGPTTNDAWVRGPRLAWENQHKLNERDRVFLKSLVGPDYPRLLPRAQDVCR